MTPNQLFSVVNPLAAVTWMALIVLPGRRWMAEIVAAWIVPGIFAVMYIAILASAWKGSAGGFSTLPDVATLFTQPWLLLAGWIHYLAFDLFVGSWEVRDARARGVPHLLVVPCLVLTFMFGPAGWLLYRLISAKYGDRIQAGGAPGWQVAGQ
jgi:hypothetical protein